MDKVVEQLLNDFKWKLRKKSLFSCHFLVVKYQRFEYLTTWKRDSKINYLSPESAFFFFYLSNKCSGVKVQSNRKCWRKRKLTYILPWEVLLGHGWLRQVIRRSGSFTREHLTRKTPEIARIPVEIRWVNMFQIYGDVFSMNSPPTCIHIRTN